jgi:hypothetical protein
MMFLLRVAFWLSIVIILLPSGSPQPTAATVDTADAVSAASAAVGDMRQFCARQPEACAVGSQAALTFGYKAQAGAKMLYEFLTETVTPTITGSVAPASTRKTDSARQSRDTLLPADQAPQWRGPIPRPDPRARRAA